MSVPPFPPFAENSNSPPAAAPRLFPVGHDFTNPCATLAILEPLYWEIIATGGREVIEVTYEQRTVRYSKANLKDFEASLENLRARCLARQALTKPRRRAFSLGRRCH